MVVDPSAGLCNFFYKATMISLNPATRATVLCNPALAKMFARLGLAVGLHDQKQAASAVYAYSTSRPSTELEKPTSSSVDEGLHVCVEPLSEQYEGISVVSLSRHKARNAIGRQLLTELQEAINTLRQERSTRCIVVRSTVPGVFCAGADLKERATMSQLETAEFVSQLRHTFLQLSCLPMPTIAAVDGHAMGGGAELALACDMRVASEASVLAFPETRLAIIPGAGGTQRLPRLVGTARAKELIFTGRHISGQDALQYGLVNKCVEAGKAYEETLQLAKEISKGGPVALRMAKQAINQGLDMDLYSGLNIEELCYQRVIPTKDRLEGLRAFAEKRTPVYTGE